MPITAKRGEFRIAEQQLVRPVAGRPRVYGTTFSPSASGSRLHVTDSGRRYEVRLRGGEVEFRTRGRWSPVRPAKGSGPWGISHLGSREGELLKPVPFEMIAVGRGRILAKEKGTDRIFHVQLDELFRTRPIKAVAPLGPADVDPIVPGNYFKLDPGFFTPADSQPFPVDPSLERDYAGHPASLRFPLFAEAMRAGSSDGMAVIIRSRTWHLIDARPPLILFDLDDLKCIGDAELKQVATRTRIKNILQQAYRGKRAEIEAGIRDMVEAEIGVDLTPNIPLPSAVIQVAEEIEEIFSDIFGVIGALEAFPIVGDLVRDLRELVEAAVDALTGLPAAVEGALEHAGEQVIAGAAIGISRALVPYLIDKAARGARDAVRADGFSALFYPGILVLALLTRELKEKGAIKIVPPAGNGQLGDLQQFLELLDGLGSQGNLGDLFELFRDFQLRGQADCSARSEFRLHVGKTVKILLQDQDNPAIRRLVQKLVAVAQAKRGVTIPNAPPDYVPSYSHVRYERDTPGAQLPPGFPQLPKPAAEAHERRSIAYRRVLDLGVGYSHWHEHWQLNYGGEMHNLLGTRPIFQQERYNLLQYRFLNGPVIDGDGYNDGTTNFYMLVELEDREKEKQPSKNPFFPARPAKGQRYGILWIDEQTYFSQRWRLLHATKDTAGDLFSIQRVLRDNPEYFRFDPKRFWCPFEEGCITGSSRMAVTRQIVAVTGNDPATDAPEIYTICFNYGVCDHSWRWRRPPPAATYDLLDQKHAGSNDALPDPGAECLYLNSLSIREDATLLLRGFKMPLAGGAAVEGRWFQKYLPADLRHTPDRLDLVPDAKPDKPFDHPWEFMSEAAYQRADFFYHFGVYEDGTDSRCQYYEVDILPGADGAVPALADIESAVWLDQRLEEDGPGPLSIDTTNFNWDLPKDEDGYLKLNELTTDRSSLPTMSMYEEATRFELVERMPLGMIARFADKRDDELQSASHLPRETILIEERRRPGKGPLRRLRVRFRANRRVLSTPKVQAGLVERVQVNGVTERLRISFWTHQSDSDVPENLWRCRLGALDASAEPVLLYSGEIARDFARVTPLSRPLPADFARPDVITGEHRFVHEFALNAAAAARVDLYCTAGGRIEFGTSLWFEDVVGHRATSETLEFATA